MAIEIQNSVLCSRCSNAQRGVVLPDGPLCFDCASDNPALVKQIVRAAMPDMARQLETAIAEAGIK
jgi:hypothetical protein